MAIAARTATRRRNPHARNHGAKHFPAGSSAAACAAGLAPATSLSFPTLQGVRRDIEIVSGEREALLFARALLAADVADPADWKRAKGVVRRFLELTLQRWIDGAYGSDRRHQAMAAFFVDSLEKVGDGIGPDFTPGRVYLAVNAGAYVPLYLSPIGAMLEAIDPRLPATIHQILLDTLYPFCNVFSVHVYGASFSADYIGLLETEAADQDDADYDPDEERGGERLREMTPGWLWLKPYTVKQLRTRLKERRYPTLTGVAADIVEGVLEAYHISRSIPGAEFPTEAQGEDWIEPWPAFVLGFMPGDDFMGVFQHWSDDRWNSGMCAAPGCLMAMDIDVPASLRFAREYVQAAARTFAAVVALSTALPTSADPRTLANVLGRDPADDGVVERVLVTV